MARPPRDVADLAPGFWLEAAAYACGLCLACAAAGGVWWLGGAVLVAVRDWRGVGP